MKNTLTRIASYEKTIFDKKNNLSEKCGMASVNLEKPSNILRSKKGYGLNISQSIIYVKEYCYVFSLP